MTLAQRYQEVSAKAVSAGAELIVVTKNHPVDLVAAIYDLGARNFGENRDQEAAPKARALSEIRSPDSTWHFVGQLQSNKVRSVLSYAKVIHSIDRPSLVKELAKQLPQLQHEVAGFIELNLTDNPGRGGVLPENLSQLAESVILLPNFRLLGLMAVAGLDKDPRAEFERVLALRELLSGIAPQARALSMGMSDDYEVALELGATHIRVGSKITGPRDYSA